MAFLDVMAILERTFKLELKVVHDTTVFEVASEDGGLPSARGGARTRHHRQMSAMEAATAFLEDLTEIESDVIAEFQNNTSGHAYELTGKTTSAGTSYLDLLRSSDVGILNNTQHYVRNDATYSNQDILYDDFIAKIESKMDEKNTFSQKTMIELQSLTAKRDQSYDMISNVLKSLNSVLVGNANNM